MRVVEERSGGDADVEEAAGVAAALFVGNRRLYKNLVDLQDTVSVLEDTVGMNVKKFTKTLIEVRDRNTAYAIDHYVGSKRA